MKIGIIGAGTVGCACAIAAVIRGCARESSWSIAPAKRRKPSRPTPLRHPARRQSRHPDGDYDALKGAGVILITSGVNEKTGGATDRNDPEGRLRLSTRMPNLSRHRAAFRAGAPEAVLLTVTDPPDPLADIAREAAGEPKAKLKLSAPARSSTPALSRPSRKTFRRRSAQRRGAGDRRPRHLRRSSSGRPHASAGYRLRHS